MIFQALREWLIIKLGGYVKKPDVRIRYEQTTVRLHKVCAMAQYTDGCPPWEIRRQVSKALADEIIKTGFVKYEYSDPYKYMDERYGVVRATIRVAEVEE